MRAGAELPYRRAQDFVDNLDPVNADADAADGFVWRLQSDDGDATAISVFDDPWLIVNMSVWRDTDALTAFMYQGRHREMLSRRRVGVPPRLQGGGGGSSGSRRP
ncbi:hypothetical protein SUDANB23_01843 [Streptomyces sp. enrichment culture]